MMGTCAQLVHEGGTLIGHTLVHAGHPGACLRLVAAALLPMAVGALDATARPVALRAIRFISPPKERACSEFSCKVVLLLRQPSLPVILGGFHATGGVPHDRHSDPCSRATRR
jgi:hypothetical protein